MGSRSILKNIEEWTLYCSVLNICINHVTRWEAHRISNLIIYSMALWFMKVIYSWLVVTFQSMLLNDSRGRLLQTDHLKITLKHKLIANCSTIVSLSHQEIYILLSLLVPIILIIKQIINMNNRKK